MSSTPATSLSDIRLLLLILAALGIVLAATTIPGVFIIDEDNYLVSMLALKQGGFTVPGTENLTPSRELAYFDPEANRRDVKSLALVSTVAPFYSLIALAFSLLGWRGLFLLNTLSFLLIAYLVFSYVQKFARQELTPWIGCAVFVLGGYSFEYAQGVWPHMLSAALCMAAFFLAANARERDSWISALLSGLVFGLATGTREQNIFVAGCVSVSVFVWSKKRLHTSFAFAAGIVVPLLAISLVNFFKIGFFHPFPKVYAYVSDVSSAQALSPLEPLRVFWAKVVDFSFSAPIDDPIKASLFHRAPGSGAVLLYGFVKKAWLQSAPWIGLAFAGFAWSWFIKRPSYGPVHRELRTLSIVVLPTLLMFSFAGFNRTDALSFNQRYFIELLPLCAIGLALILDSSKLEITSLVAGLLLGAILVLSILNLPSAYMKYSGQLRLPLIISATLILIWSLPILRVRKGYVSLVLGVAVGWSLLTHLQTDLVGSRARRADNYQRLQILRNVMPDHSALFAYWGNKDAAGPLQLEKDVVILDLWADNGRDAPFLIDKLLAQDRRVFVLLIDVPGEMLQRIISTRPNRKFSESYMNFIEILKPASTSP